MSSPSRKPYNQSPQSRALGNKRVKPEFPSEIKEKYLPQFGKQINYHDAIPSNTESVFSENGLGQALVKPVKFQKTEDGRAETQKVGFEQ